MPQAIETDVRKQRLLEELAARDEAEARAVSDALGLQDPNRTLPTGTYTRPGWQKTTPVERPGMERLEQLDPSAAEALDTRRGVQGPRITKDMRDARAQEIKEQETKAQGKPAANQKTPTKSTTSSKKAIPEENDVKSVASPKSGKGFDQLLQGAMAGDKTAVAFVNEIGRFNGFDNIKVSKDGIQYQENGEWKTATPEDMRPIFDQTIKGIELWQQYAAQRAKQQAPRQAIPTDLDPAVYRALRAKAILQGDVGDLVAYQRMPGQIDEAAAAALYRRAAAQRALRASSQSPAENVEYQYLDDGTALEVDKNTKRRLRLFDPDQQEMPMSYINNLEGYRKDMDKILDEVEDDGGQVIRNGTMNPDIKLPNGRVVSYEEYKIAKEGGFKKGHGNVGTAPTGGR